jgi:hypothetical protein
MDLISEAQSAMFDDAPKGKGPAVKRAHDYNDRVAKLNARRTRDVICRRCHTIDHAQLTRTHCRFCVGDVLPYTQEATT